MNMNVLAVHSSVKAGGFHSQHNESLAVATKLKAGKLATNHNETLQLS